MIIYLIITHSSTASFPTPSFNNPHPRIHTYVQYPTCGVHHVHTFTNTHAHTLFRTVRPLSIMPLSTGSLPSLTLPLFSCFLARFLLPLPPCLGPALSRSLFLGLSLSVRLSFFWFLSGSPFLSVSPSLGLSRSLGLFLSVSQLVSRSLFQSLSFFVICSLLLSPAHMRSFSLSYPLFLSCSLNLLLSIIRRLQIETQTIESQKQAIIAQANAQKALLAKEIKSLRGEMSNLGTCQILV